MQHIVVIEFRPLNELEAVPLVEPIGRAFARCNDSGAGEWLSITLSPLLQLRQRKSDKPGTPRLCAVQRLTYAGLCGRVRLKQGLGGDGLAISIKDFISDPAK
jgi:hypothetical protein